MSQLPPWLRHALPDPADKLYPRSTSFRALRELAACLWLPVIFYWGMVIAHFRALLDGAPFAHALLLDYLFTPEQLQGFLVLIALAAELVIIIGIFLITQSAGRDRMREKMSLAIRHVLPVAHTAVVDRVNNTLWESGLSMKGKVTQSGKHLRDVSVQAATSIIMPVLKSEGIHFAIAVTMGITVFGLGIGVVLAGLV